MFNKTEITGQSTANNTDKDIDRFSRRAIVALGVVTAPAVANLVRYERKRKKEDDIYYCRIPPSKERSQELEEIHTNADKTDYTDVYEVADYYSLTLSPAEDIERTAAAIDQTERPEDAIEKLCEFTESQYGFPIYADTIDDLYVAESASDTYGSVKDNAVALLHNLAHLPKEFYANINLSEINLSRLFEMGYAGAYRQSDKRIELDVRVLQDANTLHHELAHASEMTSCAGYNHTLAHANPKSIPYTGDSYPESLSEEEKQVFARGYGSKNPREDAATIIEAWMAGHLRLSEEIRDQPIYRKLAALLDKLDSQTPGIVGYIEETRSI